MGNFFIERERGREAKREGKRIGRAKDDRRRASISGRGHSSPPVRLFMRTATLAGSQVRFDPDPNPFCSSQTGFALDH